MKIWFRLKKIQDDNLLFKKIETMIDWIDPDPSVTLVIDSIGFNNFFFKIIFI
jgi:hypothetical protein